jgi:hypothetical protein
MRGVAAYVTLAAIVVVRWLMESLIRISIRLRRRCMRPPAAGPRWV